MKNPLRHPKRRGEWVELQFMARAATHGLTVSKPWGDSARYDFVVDSAGVFRRVQVKSTLQRPEPRAGRTGGAYLCNTVSRAPYRKEQTYDPRDVDFFAFYIVPEDLWYIVPLADIRSVKYAVTLNPHLPDNKYFRYLEAWHLLKKRD